MLALTIEGMVSLWDAPQISSSVIGSRTRWLFLDNTSSGLQIAVGDSMGAWIAVHLVETRPDRIVGIVGIAAAPDFATGDV